MKWFQRAMLPPRIEPAVSARTKSEMKISAFALDAGQSTDGNVWRPAEPMPGVVPVGIVPMAMDSGSVGTTSTSSLYNYAAINSTGTDLAFPGFPLLAELAQRPEYRHISDTIAHEMTRKWGELTAGDDESKAGKIQTITEAMERHNLRNKFRVAALHDGQFGRGHIFVDTGRDEPVGAKLSRTVASVPKGTRLRFNNVEPIWTYPNNYDSQNPLSEDFYKPRSWFVMGQSVDRSRFLTFVGRPLPDILKPAYGFAGISTTQMAIPYVQNWLRTRQSVSDYLHSFSIMVLATNLGSVLNGGGAEGLIARLQLFNQTRDNRAVMAVDKETETLSNVSAPLSGLDKLQAQAQEQMASVAGIPLVKLLGITPSGLNASSDGEIRVFYDTIAAAQESLFSEHLADCIDLIQLAEFGEIDPAIKWMWNPLWQLDEAGRAAVRKTDADTDVEYIEAGVLSPLDVRQRLARDPESAYAGIEADDVPDPPEDGSGLLEDPETNRVDEHAEGQGGETSGV